KRPFWSSMPAGSSLLNLNGPKVVCWKCSLRNIWPHPIGPDGLGSWLYRRAGFFRRSRQGGHQVRPDRFSALDQLDCNRSCFAASNTEGGDTAFLDRKSTRLNSSHV